MRPKNRRHINHHGRLLALHLLCALHLLFGEGWQLSFDPLASQLPRLMRTLLLLAATLLRLASQADRL